MRFSSRSGVSLLLSLIAIVVLAGGYLTFAWHGTAAKAAQAASTQHMHINCAITSYICTDVGESDEVFGHYVGHDEPSTLFYSNQPGSGNRARYQLTLPKDPSASNPLTPGKSYQFEFLPVFWFGMVLCDTQSYPEQVSTCAPDSDANMTALASHPGTAFTELQFYPPGRVKKFAGTSCDARDWCAALTIDSLSEDPVHGTMLNT